MKRLDFSVLIVDDDETLSHALATRLHTLCTSRCDVHTAFSIMQARKILTDHPIDYLLLGLDLPDGTAETLIEELHASDAAERSKVIILAENIKKERREKLFEMGIIDYLSKNNPVNFLANSLILTVDRHIDHQHTRILVVDDSQVYLDYITTILNNQNYQVQTSLRSKDVYDMLKESPFDLLITDMEMPELNGVELLHQIHQDGTLLDLPIIGISGSSDQELIAQLLKSGANDLIPKSFCIENFVLRVENTLSLHKKQRKLSGINEFLQEKITQKVNQLRTKDQLLGLKNRHAQMGKMVSALTHQWKQPLHGINLATDYIKMSTEDSDIVEMAETVQKQVALMSETMDYFKHFFKPTKTEESFCVMDAFDIVLKTLGDTYHNIQIHLEGDKQLQIKGYPNEFYQIIINLLNNAQDAFEEHPREEALVRIDVHKKDGRVLIELSDNAGGIPTDIIDSLFDTYVSTKGDKGTGIGLDICSAILAKMGGEIEVQNRGEGACFMISLPLSTLSATGEQHEDA